MLGCLGCVTLLCARGNLRGCINAVTGAEFDSSGLEQALLPKRQTDLAAGVMWGWDKGEMSGTEVVRRGFTDG